MYRVSVAILAVLIVITGTLAYAAPGTNLAIYNDGNYEME